MVQENIQQRLKRVRKERKLTAKAMAQMIGVPQSTYQDWEKGRGMKLLPFQAISQVLAISVTELVTGEKPPFHEVNEDLKKVEEKLHEIRAYLSSFL